MNRLATEAEAQGILKPHLDTLKTIMFEALEALNRSIGASGESPNNRAKCSWFHSIAIEKAKKYFKDAKGISMFTKYQSLQIVFAGQLVGRIKKVNKNNLSTNAKSNRNQRILNQQSLFPDFPTITFIEIAYKIDTAWAEFEKLNIVCRLFDKIQWAFSYKDIANIITRMEPTQTETLTIKEEKQIKVRKEKRK
jgi:hypothetical protein